MKYASSRTPSIIFAFRTQGLTKDSSIRYLSVHPKEEEYRYLLPALTDMLLDKTFRNPNASEVPGYNMDSDDKPVKISYRTTSYGVSCRLRCHEKLGVMPIITINRFFHRHLSPHSIFTLFKRIKVYCYFTVQLRQSLSVFVG